MIVLKTNKRLRREAINVVIASILERSGDSPYTIPEAKKLKTKINRENIIGIKIPQVLLKRSTPQGS